jgi:hypothetical protein
VHSSATASEEAAGPAHVATVSFLASRAVPTGGFWVALAGGTALARVAQLRGVREGYGASIAATLETVAIIGPARFGVPFTQALSAPMLGAMQARGAGAFAQWLACAAVRVLSNAAGAAFFILVIAGGLDAYAGTYDAVAGRVGLELGEGGTLALTAFGLFAWGAFASWVQVSVYRRGLASWPAPGERCPGVPPEPEPAHAGRFDPRVVAASAAVAFGLLLAGTAWVLLAAVSAWLAVAWVASRPDGRAVPTGLVLAGVLAAGALVFSLGGGLGMEVALRRALRAALLVLVATWLRSAAGAAGLREVSRRALRRLRALPAVPQASRILDGIGSEGRIAAAGRALLARLEGVPTRPVPFVDAVLGWVAAEAAAVGRIEAPAGAPLHVRPLDVVLAASALLPALALL